MSAIDTAGRAVTGWLNGLSGVTVVIMLAVILLVIGWLIFAVLASAKRRVKEAAVLVDIRSDLAVEQQMSAELRERGVQLEQKLESLAAAQSALAVSEHKAGALQDTCDKLNRDLDDLRSKHHQQAVDLNSQQQRLVTEKKSLEEKVQLLQKTREQIAIDFELLANKIFEEKKEQFSKTSEEKLSATLEPLKSQLSDFRKRVDDVYSNEAKERHVLQEQIKQLRAESLRISEDATNLTNALKYDNKAQGNWGELTLIRALEMCGLREPEEYQTQVSVEGEDNTRQIPDVIVHLPGGKDIIIDSKVSLLAYSRYFEAESDEQQQQAVSEHLKSVQQHIKQLSDKSYQHLPGLTTLDYVMMYIPVEGASALALQSHRGLWEEAYAKNIVLVSPTNLLAILRSVETIWRHEKQNKNAEEIARQAGNLHDKFLSLIKSLDAVGKGLEATRVAYDKAYSQLSSGRGNLVSRVQNLEKLGAKTKQEMPGHLQLAADHEKLEALSETSEDEISLESTEQNTVDIE